jgi:hypothetical protein
VHSKDSHSPTSNPWLRLVHSSTLRDAAEMAGCDLAGGRSPNEAEGPSGSTDPREQEVSEGDKSARAESRMVKEGGQVR